MYFSGQGRVYLAARNPTTGKPLAFKHVGNVPTLNLEFATETVEHKESRSGQRVTDLILTTSQTVNCTLTLEEFNAVNFATAMYGEAVAVPGSTVAAEVFPLGLAVGDYVALNHGLVSSLVITDSTGSPVTLDTDDYELVNANTGMVRIKNLTGLVQPLKAAYTYGSTVKVNMFTQPRKEYWLRFDGLNTADGNKPCTIDLYKVTLNPLSSFGLITNELAQFELQGSALYDDLQPNTGALGKFGNLDFLDDLAP